MVDQCVAFTIVVDLSSIVRRLLRMSWWRPPSTTVGWKCWWGKRRCSQERSGEFPFQNDAHSFEVSRSIENCEYFNLKETFCFLFAVWWRCQSLVDEVVCLNFSLLFLWLFIFRSIQLEAKTWFSKTLVILLTSWLLVSLQWI